MFGILKVKKCGLEPADKQRYNAHFCGGCHAMVEFGGRLSSLLTNYDVTLWLLMATALEESLGQAKPPELKPCTALPFMKVWVHPLRPEVRKTLASLNLALVGAKIEDNLLDGESKWLGYAFRPLRSAHTKALEALTELNFPVDVILRLAERQKALETTPGSSFDDLSRPTEELLSCVFAFLATLYAPLPQPALAEQLAQAGQALGSALYRLDALSDIEKDLKQGSFNALTSNFGSKSGKGWTISNQQFQQLSRMIGESLDQLEAAVVELPLVATEPLIQGLLAHLRASSKQHLTKLKLSYSPSVAEPTSGRWFGLSRSFGWGSRQRRGRAAFVAPITIQCDGCACDGCCDGCGSAGCEGCSGAGCDCCGSASCDSCSACSCGEGCSGLTCGEGCSCAELTCECCIEPGAECCCDVSCYHCGDYVLSDCCCCGVVWRDRTSQPLYNAPDVDVPEADSTGKPVRERRKWSLGKPKKKPKTGGVPTTPEEAQKAEDQGNSELPLQP